MAREDLKEDAQKQHEQMRRDAELMTQLVAHPAWARFCSLIETVGANYFDTVCAPLDNVFEVTRTEYAKGTLNGLKLCAQLPHSMIEQSKSLRAPSNEEDTDDE